jgi:NAD(P)-dependent dehydrogenase (short-subunit alcohol dehydrogenase family)
MKEQPVVIITGAANGIGKATALKFALNGYALALVDIDSKGLGNLKQVPKIAACDHLCILGDLQDPDFSRTIVESTVNKWKRIDVLINNAAWRTIETMRSISLETWEKTLKINLTSPAFLAKHAAAAMEEKNIEGVIINISSVMSHRAGGNSPAYIVCKAGLEGLTYELAVLYGPKGIRVVSINPGNIETNLSNDYKDQKGNNISEKLVDYVKDSTPLKRSGNAEEIANVSYWLSTKEASFITGTSILVDGGFFHNFNGYQMKKLQFPKEF